MDFNSLSDVPTIEPLTAFISLACAYVVHNDANKHNNPHAMYWAVGTFLAWIIFMPVYWFVNVKNRPKDESK